MEIRLNGKRYISSKTLHEIYLNNIPILLDNKIFFAEFQENPLKIIKLTQVTRDKIRNMPIAKFEACGLAYKIIKKIKILLTN